MKKLLVLFILLTIFLSGCGSGLYNLNNFVLPGDSGFLALVQELNTPEAICQYMLYNFTCEKTAFYAPNPYELWLIKKGDCNDFATFAIFIANYNNYKTYQISISFKETFIKHMLAVYVENGKYTYSSTNSYYPIYVSTFDEIVLGYFINHESELKSYEVYDYSNNLIEQVTK